MNIQNLNDQSFQIKATSEVKSLWMTARIRVYINGLLQAESKDSWMNSGKGTLNFIQIDSDASRNFRVEFDSRFTIVYVKYVVYVDHNLYTQGKVLPQKWYMPYLLTLVGLTLSIIL